MKINRNKKTSFFELVFALSTSTGIQVGIQVISIPIFLQYFTFSEYSIWIIATNLAQISNLLDLGTLSSLQNRIALLGKLKDQVQIRKIIGQFWNVIAMTHLTTILMGLALMATTDLPIYLALIFLGSSFIQITFGLYEALARMHGNIPKGLALSNILRFSEFTGYLLALVLLRVSITYIALFGLLLKLVTFIILYLKIEHHNRFIEINRMNKIIILDSIREGFPFLITRISDFIMLSGVLIVLQKQLTPLEIITFSAARTFFRFGLQVTNLYSHAYGYQMSESWADGNFNEMKRLIRKNLSVNLIFSSVGAIIYLSLGATFFEFWTHGSITLSQSLITIGAIYAFSLSISQGQKIKFNSTNSNSRVSSILLVMSIVQIIFTLTLGRILSIEMYFSSLIINEVVSFLMVMFCNKDTIAQRFMSLRD